MLAAAKKKVKKKSATKVATKKTPVKKRPKVKKGTPAVAADVEFEVYPRKHYSEEYQVTGIHYAFMSSDRKMCHHWIKCRDFLQDALRNQLTGRTDSIYSFRYDPVKDPKIDTETTRMLVRRAPTPDTADKKREFDEIMASALNLLHHYEKKYGLGEPSTLVRARNNGTDLYSYLFLSPGVWSQGPVMIAIYTFLIRLGYFKPSFKDDKGLMKAYEKIVNISPKTNDTRYLATVYKKLDRALEHMDEHLFKPKCWKKGDKIRFQDDQIEAFHHHSGIVSLAQLNTSSAEINNRFRKIFADIK